MRSRCGVWLDRKTSGDECDLANRFNGFQDRTLGAGPILTYDKKLSQSSEPPASLRGIYELDVKNRPESGAYQLTINDPNEYRCLSLKHLIDTP